MSRSTRNVLIVMVCCVLLLCICCCCAMAVASIANSGNSGTSQYRNMPQNWQWRMDNLVNRLQLFMYRMRMRRGW
jgi:hypothetical protein